MTRVLETVIGVAYIDKQTGRSAFLLLGLLVQFQCLGVEFLVIGLCRAVGQRTGGGHHADDGTHK